MTHQSAPPLAQAIWLRLLAEQLPAVLWTTAAQLVFTSGMGAGLRVLGLRPDELTGVSLHKYFGTRDPAFPPIAAHRRALEGEQVVYEQEWEGATFHTCVEPLRDENNRIIGCVGVAVDITDLKQSHDSLQQMESLFREFSAHVPALLYQTQGKPDGAGFRVPFVSDAVEMFIGCSPQEIYEDPALLLDAIYGDDRPLYYERAVEATQAESTFQADLRIVQRGGPHRYLRITSHPLKLPDGQIRFSGIGVEIDDLVQEQHRLRAENARLSETMHQQMTDLIALNRQLQQEREQKQQADATLQEEQRLLRRLLDLQEKERQLVAYDIHDGFVQDVVGAEMLVGAMIDDEEEGGPLVEARAALHRAISEARRLIGDLRPKVIDEEGVAGAVEFLVQQMRQRTDMTIELEQDIHFDRLPSLLEGTIYRIVQESLNNAIRHSKSPVAHVRLKQTDSQLEITIRDEGIGFDERRVPPDHFGLEGIRQRARLFGGEATIQSTLARGTTVRVVLPLSEN